VEYHEESELRTGFYVGDVEKIARNYSVAIGEAVDQTRRACDLRLQLAAAERYQAAVKARVIVNHEIPGKNEAERGAGLLLFLDRIEEYRDAQADVDELRRRVADCDARVFDSREYCRIWRLQLALSASEPVLEAANG
jgi:hypothetical protein